MTGWFEHHHLATSDVQSSINRAVVGGFCFRQTSFAFASAYQSAMESMFKLERQSIAALCHTEKGVRKPRDMQTAISTHNGKMVVNGAKSFVSGGADAQTLFVSALDRREGMNSEQAAVRIIRMEANRKGIEAKALPTLPFVPELSHAALALSQVTISEEDILDGDGYVDFIKPFRTEEDIHILAALSGQRLRIALDQKQLNIATRLISLISGIQSLETASRNSACCHLQLAGIKASFEDIVALQAPFIAESLPIFHSAWERDKALLSIAEQAQAIRTERAWHHFLGDDFIAAD